MSQGKPWLNHGIEINYVTTTVVRSLTYKEGHALCEGRDASMKEEQKVMENRASILADHRQGQGINTDCYPHQRSTYSSKLYNPIR